MMLVLTRKVGESIRIGDDIVVHVRRINGSVRLAIDAPRDTNIVRAELTQSGKDGQKTKGGRGR